MTSFESPTADLNLLLSFESRLVALENKVSPTGNSTDSTLLLSLGATEAITSLQFYEIPITVPSGSSTSSTIAGVVIPKDAKKVLFTMPTPVLQKVYNNLNIVKFNTFWNSSDNKVFAKITLGSTAGVKADFTCYAIVIK